MPSTSLHDRLQNLPSFEELPLVAGQPGGCTWGLWDVDGVRDELGTLNLLTPETVRQAAEELKFGIRISLNWSLVNPATPVFRRQKLQHTIIDNSTFSPSKSFDDAISINTQSGSQWDGLRHVLHHQTNKLYNGFDKSDIIGPKATDVLGLNKWHNIGGIAGRGVLIDYVAYAERHGIAYSPIEYHGIDHIALEDAAREQNLVFKQGDILLVRTGLTKWCNTCRSAEDQTAYFVNPAKQGVGVVPSPDTAAWVWNHHFAAVAGDSLAWEPMPYPTDSPSFHEYLLAMWGTPIGELWDLETLAATCATLGQYSFFLTSCPLNVPGGVASPPNAMAIF